MSYKINENCCIGCGECKHCCPVHAIKRKGYVCKIEVDECIDCGVCSQVCPTDAITEEQS